MKIKSLTPYAFGKFHLSEPISLSDGLNLVVGENEAGKSTLAAFILGLLYGFKKEGKVRVIRTPEFERYRPWSGQDYQGTMVFEDGGRIYRLERSFDPDVVRVFDDATGEDITRSYVQDSRKEYDIAKRHLGLSQREFMNTVWIGQLQSPQEPGLSAEIQGKLEAILQGGTEDVSVARALSVLSEEKAKIKTSRSTKARLDLVSQEIRQLEDELRAARSRESQIRGWLVESVALGKRKAELSQKVQEGERDLQAARYVLLKSILSGVCRLEEDIAEARERLSASSWAKDLPEGAQETYQATQREKESLTQRCLELEAQLEPLARRKSDLKAKLDSFSDISNLGLDEAGMASLYSRYVSSKATASRGERSANEARKELRLLEDELKSRGFYNAEFDESVLKTAEEHQETCILAEKEKARLEIEVERARAVVASRNPGGASSWIYALSLGILGIAIALTIMGLPFSVPAFGVALIVFGMGVYRHRKVAGVRAQDMAELKHREEYLSDQIGRVEAAKTVLAEYLAAAGVRSVEELRTKARETNSARERLKRARDKYAIAHDAWFEASQEFSQVEKEFRGILEASGCLAPGEVITDQAVDQLKKRVRETVAASQELKSVQDRIMAIEASLADYRRRIKEADEKQGEVFSACKVANPQEFLAKVDARAEYAEASRLLQQAEERERAILSGRTIPELHQEVSLLEQKVDPGSVKDASITQSEYERKRRILDELKSELAEINTSLAKLENGIGLWSSEGRGSGEIEEDLARARALEEELSEDREALELAYSTLESLSRSIHKEFAPELNRRVGEVLSEITEGRYSEVRVTPDLEMSVLYPGTGVKTPIGSLSGGTLDQCYFALRVAVAEVVTRKREFPLFLDDSFVQYDDVRLRGALKVLGTLAKGGRHQIVLLSCHGREEAAARELGVEFNLIRL